MYDTIAVYSIFVRDRTPSPPILFCEQHHTATIEIDGLMDRTQESS